MWPPTFSEAGVYAVQFKGRTWEPAPGQCWATNPEGMQRLINSERIETEGKYLRYLLKLRDDDLVKINTVWNDTIGARDQSYVIETSPEVVKRCMLMTTDPGDLVLDPTCGGGTTAFVAEEWGRRWITMDTSRVAVALTRQRLLTARFPYYTLKDEGAGISKGIKLQTKARISARCIAQNRYLDPIFAKYEPILDEKLRACNSCLKLVSEPIRHKLELKLIDKQKSEGKKSITEGDRHRWQLPAKGEGWEHWTVPFDTDPDYPKDLTQAVTAYRKAWRAKMDEVNACIAANADPEEQVDQPETVRGVVRVSGPFSVEAVQPPEISLGAASDQQGLFDGEPEALDATFSPSGGNESSGYEAKNLEAYLDQMTRLLSMDGVRFPDNKEMVFSRLNRICDPCGIHAEGRWAPRGETDKDPEGVATVGVVFGPQYGQITVKMVEQLVKPAGRRYDDLLLAGFNFAGEVFDIAANPHPRLRIHVTHIRPDVSPGMTGLLKEQPRSQLFTVFGQPRTTLKGPDKRGEYKVRMEGVDIYDPRPTPSAAPRTRKWRHGS